MPLHGIIDNPSSKPKWLSAADAGTEVPNTNATAATDATAPATLRFETFIKNSYLLLHGTPASMRNVKISLTTYRGQKK